MSENDLNEAPDIRTPAFFVVAFLLRGPVILPTRDFLQNFRIIGVQMIRIKVTPKTLARTMVRIK